jgi:hypothetical protein
MKKYFTRKSESKTMLAEHKNNQWKIENWDKMVPVKLDQEILQIILENIQADSLYWNDTYQCRVSRNSDYTHLSIVRHDREPIHCWQHIQQIKNDVCGEDCEGIELYPAMSRIVDNNNFYHLWVLEPGKRIEVGFRDRLVIQ